ncbi:hypothetical protein [Mycobacterium sp. JS623]|uniref:hypothetical protein n=1 Tax=Mycobacterium sp. JS623 TaxID=212767 RepID=UPI0012FB0CD8|nr:hypothetical protein [Mycobacterium sp. JS623]
MTVQHPRPLTRMDIRLGYVAARVGVTYDDKTCWEITDALIADAPLDTWSVEGGQVVTTADPDFWSIVTNVVGA